MLYKELLQFIYKARQRVIKEGELFIYTKSSLTNTKRNPCEENTIADLKQQHMKKILINKKVSIKENHKSFKNRKNYSDHKPYMKPMLTTKTFISSEF
jgi:hypothetical protein